MFNEIMLAVLNFLTSLLTAVSGLGGGMILIGLMPMFLPALAIIPVHGATQLASNASRAWFGRNKIDWRNVYPFLLGSLLGVAVFGMAVRFIELQMIPLFIGVYILLIQWSKTVNRWLKSMQNFYLIGFLQTGLGIFVGSPGPLNMPLLIQKYDDNDTVIAMSAIQQSILHSAKVLIYVAMGFAFWEYWQVVLAMVVSAILGSWVGVRIRSYVPASFLKRMLPWLLTALAIKVIISNLITLGWVQLSWFGLG
ncbi:sulfite exporter TauE/SafE family protein [Neisseria animalis]|uniref:Probable membrane transporter protein n=1 Tax=Neisseria animalis TaxID=492 RepID=A0A5P3MPX3_NEIAN|nr:sulfite exporter TauE/SafE family protein [Neisseria animalis]QEY23606.1 sulfite exporter TauE/SafE family protein [Neisseria animalis]ROW32750.1 sulfite exporter TauE/SafE family protein [Neisseria animalis]VEE09319.1 Sulfite exporter TauE/SafE [Neisseria animalis]